MPIESHTTFYYPRESLWLSRGLRSSLGLLAPQAASRQDVGSGGDFEVERRGMDADNNGQTKLA